MQWQKCFGGSVNDKSSSVIQTTDGNYVLLGSTSSNDGDVSGNHGASDFWIMKTNTSGDLQWQKCLGGSEIDYGYSVIETADGGYIATGITYSDNGDVSGNHGNLEIWATKLNSAGILQAQLCLGGTSDDQGKSIIQTAAGSFALVGHTYSNNGDVSGNHGLIDVWVANFSFPVGVDEVPHHQPFLSVFPNPVTNLLMVELKEQLVENLTVYDMLGQKCLTRYLLQVEQNITLDVSSLASGVYFLKARNNRSRFLAKFTKQ
ncbi:MAG: T9SS type A sorting domain-containing protein [Chitinophagales bacterium]|nr:T9SS type A sorting domain-containing protein [Chitinophagales bacterium]MDW8392828.1 T9SS type A sorting domain-containing protein [Chitinophagales bacterium]